MAVFLVEDEVGFDTNRIGFPNMGSCLAVVLQTTNGLYGFHIPPGRSDRVGAFAHYVRQRDLYGGAQHLYGSCYFANRFARGDEPAGWKKEMTQIAAGLGYHGPVSGFDSSVKSVKLAYDKALYIEYRCRPVTGSCTIHYKRMTKMDVTKEKQPEGDDILRVKPDGKAPGGFGLGAPMLGKIVTDTSVKKTWSNEGEIHQAGTDGFHTFDV
jgi:hypothetical protein